MGDADEAKVLATELEYCKTQLQDDNERADALIAYTNKIPEPFKDDFAGENPWVSSKGGGGGGGCVIL